MQGPPSNPENPRVFFEISMANPINGKMTVEGRITMELFADAVPKTAENFRCLCTGEKNAPGRKLHYKQTPFHRIIPGFMCQAGDTTRGNGTGGYSIYGEKFRDESFKGKAGRHFVGALSMANAGPNTNGSQFFLCTAPCTHLNGQHVVFGKIVEGMDVVRKVEKQGSPSGKTRVRVVISDCGEIKNATEAAGAAATAVNKKDQLASIKRLEPTETKLPPGAAAAAASLEKKPQLKQEQQTQATKNPLSFAAAKSKALAQAQAQQQQQQNEGKQETASTPKASAADDESSPGSAGGSKLLRKAELMEKQAQLLMKRAALLRSKAVSGTRRDRDDDGSEGPEVPEHDDHEEM